LKIGIHIILYNNTLRFYDSLTLITNRGPSKWLSNEFQ
jgi:hypothetical protein